MKEERTASAKEEVKEMTNYYVQIARYFLSTGILTGFGFNLGN